MTFRWVPILPGAEKRLAEVLKSWNGTRYMAGQRTKGVGADCKEFVVAVLDELYRFPNPSQTARLTPDAGMRDVRLGLREVRSIMRSYPDVRIVRDGTIQPGDVVLTRSSDLPGALGRPGHAMIVGPTQGTAWHAARPRVCQTSLGAGKGTVRVYRPGKKGWWV